MQITNNFTLAELCHSNTAVARKIANEPNEVQIANLTKLAKNVLQPIRDKAKKAITISSGFRNQKVNALVGGEATSQHMKGEASDFNISGLSAIETFNFVIDEVKAPFDQIILYSDGENSFVHVSYKEGKNRGQILYSKNTKYRRK